MNVTKYWRLPEDGVISAVEGSDKLSVSVGDILRVYNYVIKTLSLYMNKILSLGVSLYRPVHYTMYLNLIKTNSTPRKHSIYAS